MINFPIFEKIDIVNYGLFPGKLHTDEGLHINFCPGLTLVLGANGLGKTTLITMMFRILTGPFDISDLSRSENLGSINTKPTLIPLNERRMFANRVVDGARNSYARLEFSLGTHKISIERNLHELTLKKFTIDERDQVLGNEELLQQKITELAGVSSFGDWILLLRFIVFYFEDRRALVWDKSAQKQILRILFLQPDIAKKWSDDERQILEMDSRMRNLQAVANREVKSLTENEVKIENSQDTRSLLEDLEKAQEADKQSLGNHQYSLMEIEKEREDSRLHKLRAEQELETASRKIERLKILVIGNSFPDFTETTKFILTQLLSNNECLVCGSNVPDIAQALTEKSLNHECVICGSKIRNLNNIQDKENYYDEIDEAIEELKRTKDYHEEACTRLNDVEDNYRITGGEIFEINKRIENRGHKIDFLLRQLPPDEVEIHKKRYELSMLQTRVEILKEELDQKRSQFSNFVEEVNKVIVRQKDAIKDSFDEYAKGFLLEKCVLRFSQYQALVGQTGKAISFPSFELDMSGSNFPSPVKRSGPEQVSESQREFIDLGFRMALISVSSNEGAGSLVMDAPESSLDAVFSTRAAKVLSLFGNPFSKNRLVITSNLIEGKLIPELIAKMGNETVVKDRIVDLLNLSAPTAAVKEHRKEYQQILEHILSK